ncbi:MAG: MotA/TolQ/ExbB proton channel family protein [Planctomycetota bacterium]
MTDTVNGLTKPDSEGQAVEMRLRRWRLELALKHGLLKRELDELEDHIRAGLNDAEVLHAEHALEQSLAKLGDSKSIARELRRSRRGDLAHSAVGVFIVGFFTLLVMLSAGNLGIYIDIPSFIWVGAIVIGGLWVTYRPRTAIRSFAMGALRQSPRDLDDIVEVCGVLRRGRQLGWASGVLGSLLQTIAMLADLSDPAAIGAGIAVALLTTLYGALLAELVFAPMLHTVQQRRDQIEAAAALA